MNSFFDTVLNVSGFWAYALIFLVLLLCGLGLPMPEDIVLFAAGLLVYYENVDSLWIMIFVSMLGVMVGDSFTYFLGYKYGPTLIKKKFFAKIINPSRVSQVQELLHKKGNRIIFAARFMPGLRAPIFFTSGMLHLPYKVFALYDGFAALISVPLIVFFTDYFGENIDTVVKYVRQVQHGILAVIVAAILLALIKWYLKKRKLGQAPFPKRTVVSIIIVAVVVILLGAGWVKRSKAKKKLQQQNPVVVPVTSPTPHPSEQSSVAPELNQWCSELEGAVKKFGWKKALTCKELLASGDLRIGGYSHEGRPLVYAEYGNEKSRNRTLILSMVHPDEITPLYSGLMLLKYLGSQTEELKNSRVLVAPLVNPDGLYRNPKTRTNARGVDVNRNFATADWDKRALEMWKKNFQSNSRRFPGKAADSESETLFQKKLISEFIPQKIISIHAPLNYMDYDGPNVLTLKKFPKEYVERCLQLRKNLRAVSTGFFPGSLGNYAGQERGIPTFTLELPTANPNKAFEYWEKFKSGIQTVIHYEVPDSVAFSIASPEREQRAIETD